MNFNNRKDIFKKIYFKPECFSVSSSCGFWVSGTFQPDHSGEAEGVGRGITGFR